MAVAPSASVTTERQAPRLRITKRTDNKPAKGYIRKARKLSPIILAYEPTGNLDSVTAGEIIDILKTLAKDKNKCVIVVTHSKEVADSADIILELSGKNLKKVNKMNLEVE